MSAAKLGYIKWFREDGTGYIIEEGLPDDSLFVDKSVIKHNEKNNVELKKGQKVKFKTKMILGRKVAIDVEPL